MPSPPTIAPVLVADLPVEGERMPVYVHVIDHPDAPMLVDTGMSDLHPAVADLDPRLISLSEQDFDLAGIDVVVNTHLRFDHCGGNHLFAGKPIYVQRRELDDARSEDDYTIREWVEAPGVRYVPIDGELELLPGLRLVPAPGHTRGSQVVVVETGGRPVVVVGDVAVSFDELDEPRTDGQLRVRALDPELVWLAHEHEPWRPRTGHPATLGRMTRPPLEDAFGHHVWATIRLIDGCSRLSPQELETPAPGTYGSILDTMRHLVGADTRYLSGLTDEAHPGIDEEHMDLMQLRVAIEGNGVAWSTLLAGDLDVDTIIVTPGDDGSEDREPVGIYLAQALHHGTDHRSQICTALTALGVEPPSIDVWDFGLATGRSEYIPPPS